MKYHVNPSTGVPGQCTASSGRCPFGDSSTHFDTPKQAVAAFETKLEKELIANVAAAPSAPSTRPRPATSDNSMRKDQIPLAVNGPSAAKPVQNYYGILAPTRINPQTGDGDAYGHYQNGAVILGKADGTRLRLMAGAGELTNDPAELLGQRITLEKQHSSGTGITRDLRVLGYVDSSGNKFGYVPDKTVHYFIFK